MNESFNISSFTNSLLKRNHKSYISLGSFLLRSIIHIIFSIRISSIEYTKISTFLGISEYSSYFNNPVDLATRFGLDIYIGIKKSLGPNTNGLGKKAEELLSYVDPNLLREREIQLENLRNDFLNSQ